MFNIMHTDITTKSECNNVKRRVFRPAQFFSVLAWNIICEEEELLGKYFPYILNAFLQGGKIPVGN